MIVGVVRFQDASRVDVLHTRIQYERLAANPNAALFADPPRVATVEFPDGFESARIVACVVRTCQSMLTCVPMLMCT